MSEIITGLTLPIVLSVSGAVFVLLGIAGNVELKGIVVRLSHGRQRGMTAFGVVLVLLGVSVYVLSVVKSSSIASPPPIGETMTPTTAVTTLTPTSASTATCFSTLKFGTWDASYSGYGDANRIPVPADYDGDGRADLSVKDADGVWWIDCANNGFGTFDEWHGGYGDASRIPVQADYDGDGRNDLSVKDPDGIWWIDYASK